MDSATIRGAAVCCAALYSSLVPGTGQLVGGARKRGYALLGVVVALLAVCVALRVRGGRKTWTSSRHGCWSPRCCWGCW